MRVKKLDEKAVGIFFEYSPNLVSIVKSLPGRSYEPKLKAWLLPIQDGLFHSNLKRLAAAGFSVPPELYGQGGALLPQPINDLNAWVLPKNAELRPFQVEGVKFLLAGNMLLGDKPGLGKTIQALTVVHTHKFQRTLVLTFASLKYQFQAEVKKFFPNSSVVVIDGGKKERANLWKQEANFYIANYELLLRDLELMTAFKWDAILADECTRLSKHTNKQSRALKFVRSDFKIAMTGTAISNSPLDIFGIMEWLRPGMLGNYSSFVNRYVVKDVWGSAKYYKNLPELAQRIKPFYISRTREEVLPELPEKIKIDIPVRLSDKELTLYNQIRAQLLLDIEQASISKVSSPAMMQNTVVNITRLRQLSDSMELLGEHSDSSKLTALKELLSTLNGGKKIIFSEFAEMCKILQRELPGSLMIIGETSTHKRDEIVQEFNSSPDRNILVMSSAGAYGLNLQAADTIIHYDFPWSIAKYEQRSARAHRMGQKNTVYEYSLIAEKTVDEWVKKKLENKQSLSEMVFIKEIISMI